MHEFAQPTGTHIGRYRLERRMGGGSLSEVFEALDPATGRTVAIKILRLAVQSDSQHAARLAREIAALRELGNPHTVRILDHGQAADGSPFYAMERLVGLDLAELVQRFGRLSDGRARHLLLQVCDSLSEAHAAGWVHRDIKPSNAMLSRSAELGESLKLLDFGLALRPPDEASPSSASRRVVGSPMFMSPEAAQAADSIDARSDIYSLGCLAYFLLSGQGPFSGRTSIEICWKQIHAPAPALRAQSPAPISREIESLVMRCLAKQPADRPQSAVEIAEYLGSSVAVTPWTAADAQRWWLEHKDD